MDWFLYGIGLRHERVNAVSKIINPKIYLKSLMVIA